MKIAIIVPGFPILSETFIINHITGLIDAGHDVVIYALRKNVLADSHKIINEYDLLKMTRYLESPQGGKTTRRIKTALLTLRHGLRHPIILFRGLHYLMFANREECYSRLYFLFMMIRQKHDVYHFHFAQVGRFGAFLKSTGLKFKMVTSFHGYDVNKLPRQKNEDFYQALFETGNHFIANTHFTKQQANQLGCDNAKMSVIPVGLHIKDFPFNTKNLRENEVTRILTVGRLVEKKGYPYSIRAMADLIKQGFNLHYTIAGDGPLRNELVELAESLGISDHLTFLGEITQEDVIRLYKQSHIFVLSSVTAQDGDKEGQGLVLQEAQASGLPIVSTWHNGIPDGVLDGQSGTLVPEKDVGALSKAIKDLLNNPATWSEMGKKGRQFVKHKYDMKTIIAQLVNCYRSL